MPGAFVMPSPNLHCNYTLPIDLAPNGIPFGDKSIGKVYIKVHLRTKKSPYSQKLPWLSHQTSEIVQFIMFQTCFRWISNQIYQLDYISDIYIDTYQLYFWRLKETNIMVHVEFMSIHTQKKIFASNFQIIFSINWFVEWVTHNTDIYG